MKQIVTIHPDGTISGLQVKPGQGMDLTEMGEAEVRRASEIEWNTEHQAWQVRPLGPPDGSRMVTRPVTLRMYSTATNQRPFEAMEALKSAAPSGVGVAPGDDGVLLFKNYTEAVKIEIQYLDGLRVMGVFW
jgi:hypothetical protein